MTIFVKTTGMKLLGYIFGLAALLSGTVASSAQGTDRCLEDVRYAPARAGLDADAKSSDRLMDIYYPEGTAPGRGWPVFVFIHGGGFTGGDKSMLEGSTKPIREKLNKAGFAVVSVNYYLYSKYNRGPSCRSQMSAGFPESGRFSPETEKAIDVASEDAALALKYIRKNSRRLKLDKSRLAVGGGSAGAMTALDLAFVRRPSKPRIRAVVNCWGAVPTLDRLSSTDIPVLTIHGTEDDLVSVSYGKGIQHRLESIGSTGSRMILLEGRGHAQYKYVGENLMEEIIGFLDETMVR